MNLLTVLLLWIGISVVLSPVIGACMNTKSPYEVTCPACQAPPGRQCEGVYCPQMFGKDLRDVHYNRLVAVGLRPPPQTESKRSQLPLLPRTPRGEVPENER